MGDAATADTIGIFTKVCLSSLGERSEISRMMVMLGADKAPVPPPVPPSLDAWAWTSSSGTRLIVEWWRRDGFITRYREFGDCAISVRRLDSKTLQQGIRSLIASICNDRELCYRTEVHEVGLIEGEDAEFTRFRLGPFRGDTLVIDATTTASHKIAYQGFLTLRVTPTR